MSVSILVKESLIAAAENSVGSKVFRTLYARKDGVVTDILEGGEVSCANFVSTLLHRFQLLPLPHVTVQGLIRGLEASGWRQVQEPEAGDVLIWQAIVQASEELHAHCGIYLGDTRAVSNDYRVGMPIIHHFTDELPGRAITAIYRHPSFTT